MTHLRNDFFSLLIFGLSLACLACCFNERDVRYKGPSEVWEGDPFEISCILTLRDLKGWTVNGTLVTEDNAGGYVLNERPVDAFRMEVALGARAAQLHHVGAYRCNRFSRDAHYLNVIPAFADTAIEEESPTRKSTNDYILEINKTNEFFCSSAKDDDVPVMWFKNGALIKESLKSNIIIAGLNLIIENPQEDDAGEYMCTVDTSKVAGYTYIGRIFHLNSPPRIVTFPKKTSIIQGQDLKIICQAKGYPVPKFTWFIGNLNATKLKETDPRIFIDTDNTKKSVLVVERVSFSDRGLYTCRAENSLDSGSTIEYDEESVFVHVRDNVIETNEDQLGMGKVLILEEDLQLQCNTTNCPHCVISWSKDGKTLYPIPDHLKIHEANQSITIENASYDDSGVYVCSVDFMPLDSTDLLPDNLQCKQKSSGSNEYSEEDDELEENVYICQAYNQVKAMHTTIVIDVKTPCTKWGHGEELKIIIRFSSKTPTTVECFFRLLMLQDIWHCAKDTRLSSHCAEVLCAL
ncbi:hypothetical protein JTE90_001220 [Oedothorax gibbosus]|uniref:Ig-like domain-containing protein n=1 Tax=Oedothorax gibbosus TaxID=931172 RepID=A0AAV6UX11_9ARAC|nr:hypothetical protein JTE90_001220 [Oedothorax gibbosus]